jgi:transcription antitermination factor NusG
MAAPGVIGIVSCGPQRLPVSEREIEAVRRAVAGSSSVQPWPYLNSGTRVRVVRGSLTGVEGLVVQDSNDHRLVLHVHLLQRAISLKIDRDWIEPIETPTFSHA